MHSTSKVRVSQNQFALALGSQGVRKLPTAALPSAACRGGDRPETPTVVTGSNSARTRAIFFAEGPLAQNINHEINSKNETGQKDS